MKKFLTIIIVAMLTAWGAGCSQSGSNNNSSGNGSASGGNEDGLTAFEKEHGIGPVDEKMELGPIKPELASEGEELFTTNCSSCHKLDERYVGPSQRDVLDQRSPEFVMNMILNPAEMLKKHPVAKKMLAEYMTPMPYQNVSREEARAILEYFRYVNKHKSKDSVSE